MPHGFPRDLAVFRNALAAAAIALLPAIPIGAEPLDAERTGLPVEDLKSAYLSCELGAMSGELGAGSIAQCSVIYEELKERAFDGDYRKLRTWYDLQRVLLRGAGAELSAARALSGSTRRA